MEKQLMFEYLVPIKESVSVGKDFIIKGVAINETTTRNNVRYMGEELSKAAPSLQGKPILKDHENSVDNIIGRVMKSSYDPMMKCVCFEGKVMEKKYQEMITDGRINSVSIGAMVSSVETSEEEGSPMIPRGIDFVELSLVAIPADPNAGFAQAMCESFKKEKVLLDSEVKSQKIAENIVESLVNKKSEPVTSLSSMATTVNTGYIAAPNTTISATSIPYIYKSATSTPSIITITSTENVDDIKIKQEEAKMEEDLKSQLSEALKTIEAMKAEKVAQEKAREEAEKVALAERLKKLEEENASLKKISEAKAEMKGVVTTQTEKKTDAYEGYSFAREGKGFSMWIENKDLDSKYAILKRD